MWKSLLVNSFCIVISCLFTNCSKSVKSDFEPPVFKEQGKAQYDLLSGAFSVKGVVPKDMVVYDQYLVVLAWDKEHWVHFYDKENGQYLGGCIKQGRGPGEVIIPDNLDVYDGKIGMFDSQTKRYSIFNVSKKEDRVVMVSEKVIRLDTYPYAPLRAYQINDEDLLVDGQLPLETDKPRQRFHLLQDGKELFAYTNYPMDGEESIGAYIESRIALSPDRKKFVCGTLYGATLEIFNSGNLQLQDQRLFYEPKVTNEKGVWTAKEDMIWGFADLTASDDAIYGIFIEGKTPNDLGNIAVFDWKGNPMRRFSLDQITVQLAYSSSDNTLYGIAFDHETGFRLVKYRMN